MTVVELKALAKKRKVSLSAGDKKADIIKALVAVSTTEKPARKLAVVSLKQVVGKSDTSVKKSVKKDMAKKAVVSTGATKKAVKSSKGATIPKPVAKKRSSSAGKTRPKTILVREWKLPPGVEEPLMAQERVSESKYYTGPLPLMPAVALR